MALLRERVLPPITGLAMQFEKEGNHTVFRKSAEGLLYGITFIDHTTKNVFNGSSLGKQYSAKAIEERCRLKIAGEEKRNQISEKSPSIESLISNLEYHKDRLTIPDLTKVLDMLMHAEYSADYLPNQLINKRRKKRKKDCLVIKRYISHRSTILINYYSASIHYNKHNPIQILLLSIFRCLVLYLFSCPLEL